MLKRNILALSEIEAGQLLREEVLQHGWKISVANDLGNARKQVIKNRFFVGVMDFSAFDPATAFQWQEELASINPAMLWLALVPPPLMDDGGFRKDLAGRFFDYHTIPHDPERLRIILGHAFGMAMLKPGKAEGYARFNHAGLIGESPAMAQVFRDLKKAAAVDYPVLISGESGTGKALLAQAIHRSSARSDGPFISVNCAALPVHLIEAELFGYEAGGLAGAMDAKRGCIESAGGGTLFLDEIGDVPGEVQTVLLRFIQERVIHRLGSSVAIPVDVRVIAATHVNLEASVAAGQFRQDLFYRLNVLRMTPPPLRDRGNDVILLANYFLDTYRDSYSQIQGFTSQALDILGKHHWPGNVRELVNRIRRAVVMSENRLISAADLGFTEADYSRHGVMSIEQARAAAEKHAIQVALWRSGHNVSLAAKSLEISRMTLYRLMEKAGISCEKPDGADYGRSLRMDEPGLEHQPASAAIPPFHPDQGN